MPSFTPPTYGVKINDETQGGEPARYSLWRHYGTPIQTGYVVLIRSGAANASPGTVTPNSMTQITGNAEVPNATANYTAADDGSGEGGLAYFRGGIQYTITAAEDTILKAAGYTTSTS